MLISSFVCVRFICIPLIAARRGHSEKHNKTANIWGIIKNLLLLPNNKNNINNKGSQTVKDIVNF